jgi:predicted metallopeptidase
LIKYIPAPDIKFELESIVRKLGMNNVRLNNVVCMRSVGSQARYTLARCWGLPKIWQLALGVEPHYIVEVISEKYDRLSTDEKEKILIHELMHIPKRFLGGLRKHDDKLTTTISDSDFVDKLHNLFKLRSAES